MLPGKCLSLNSWRCNENTVLLLNVSLCFIYVWKSRVVIQLTFISAWSKQNSAGRLFLPLELNRQCLTYEITHSVIKKANIIWKKYTEQNLLRFCYLSTVKILRPFKNNLADLPTAQQRRVSEVLRKQHCTWIWEISSRPALTCLELHLKYLIPLIKQTYANRL